MEKAEQPKCEPTLKECLQVIGEALQQRSESMRDLVQALEYGFAHPVAVPADQKVSELERVDNKEQSAYYEAEYQRLKSLALPEGLPFSEMMENISNLSPLEQALAYRAFVKIFFDDIVKAP